MELQDVIVGYIDRWLDEKETRKLSVLGKMTGIDYHALRRIYKKESTPNIGNILPLCDTICEFSETLEIIETFFPKLKRYFAGAEDARTPFSLAKVLKQDTYQLPVLMAASEGGTTKEQIDATMGELGLTAVNELISLEILSIDDHGNINLGSQKHFIVFNSEVNKSVLSTLLSIVDTNRVTSSDGHLRFAFEGFRDDVISELDNDILNLHYKITEYMKDPTKHGSKKWFCGLFSSSIKQRG